MNQFSGHWDVGTLGTFCKLLIISNFIVKLPVSHQGIFPYLYGHSAQKSSPGSD